MNVLILGSGGREHALAWKISQSKELDKLFCMSGNPGTATIATNLSGDTKYFAQIEDQIRSNNINMLVVGPEVPLVDGIRDYFGAVMPELMVIGPDKKGAALEGSKDFAKEFMIRHNIPTARYKSFTSDTIHDAYRFLGTLKPPYVLKADGLAAGKGVVITDNLKDAERELSEMFEGKFDDAGHKVVIEEFLSGIELSVFVLTDGVHYMILPEAKDYKRIGEHDTGLNTGGMGSVSPVPFADKAFMGKVEERIIKPTIAGLRSEGIDYCGFIFIGLMNCGGDPYVIEYNVRMGDPETESVMRRIDSDLLGHLAAAAKGELDKETIRISSSSAVTVVAVSGGYPEHYIKGFQISGLPDCSKCSDTKSSPVVFHAGTAMKDGKTVTSGGRVLAVTAMGDNIFEAGESAYKALSEINFENIYYRKDITDDLKSLCK